MGFKADANCVPSFTPSLALQAPKSSSHNRNRNTAQHGDSQTVRRQDRDLHALRRHNPARAQSPVREVDVMNGEHKTPEYLENQPFGQIPYIDGDGFVLYETRAICRYIATKHPASGLLPTDPKANALFEQAAAAQADAHLAVLDKKLNAYEAILSAQRYMAGDTFTLADAFHLPYAPLVASRSHPVTSPRRPNVARWYTELKASLVVGLWFCESSEVTKNTSVESESLGVVSGDENTFTNHDGEHGIEIDIWIRTSRYTRAAPRRHSSPLRSLIVNSSE
ncbi:hypothetical protein B0H13DRAFT_1889919 [Mycena leptocephala]|nr:hypothetical protein B0H13DRAFT_1889919 [Mycena leptocephala]